MSVKNRSKHSKTKKYNSLQYSNYLKDICYDSHYCIGVGIEKEKINNFFNHYIDFKYATSPIYTINEGNNGFIKKIIYKRQHFKAYAILKFQIKNNKDSLFYEYLVGFFLNNYLHKVPSFITTYGLFEYTSNTGLKENINVKDLKKLLNYVDINIHDPNFAISCTSNISILLEDIKPYYLLDNIIKNIEHYHDFVNIELISCLYQLYFTLSFMHNHYTHYDLHLGNVLYYKPDADGYIKFVYHHVNKTKTTFYSQYLVKIIDYARSYINNQHNFSSQRLQQQLCNTKECEPYCGDNFGYYWINNKPSKNNSFISSKQRNISHDLRYLYEIKRTLEKYNIDKNKYPKINDLVSHVLYGVGVDEEKEKRYGTIEINKSNYEKYEQLYPNYIKNVIDAKNYIQQLLSFNNDYFKQFHEIGELHIYENGQDMKYIHHKN